MPRSRCDKLRDSRRVRINLPITAHSSWARVAMIRGFKGLEADAIMVADVQNPDSVPFFSVADFYVACSRAKHLLVILATEKTDA